MPNTTHSAATQPSIDHEANLLDPPPLKGSSIALLYAFPERFDCEADTLEKMQGDPEFGFYTAFPPVPADSAIARGKGALPIERLPWEFGSLETIAIGQGNTSVRRWLLNDKEVGLSVAVGRLHVDTTCMVTVFCNVGVAFLTVNAYSPDFQTDDLIAWTHSGLGRNDQYYKDDAKDKLTRESRRRCVVAISNPECNINDGGCCHASLCVAHRTNKCLQSPGGTCDHISSIRCAAVRLIKLFIRQYSGELFGSKKLSDNDPYAKNSDGYASFLVDNLHEPLRCIELKRQLQTSETDEYLIENAQQHMLSNSREVYGLVTGDEGWRFVPKDVAGSRVKGHWQSREFFSVVAFGHGVVMVNFTDRNYERAEDEYWKKYWPLWKGEYHLLDSNFACLEHCALNVVENTLVTLALQRDSKSQIATYLKKIEDFAKNSHDGAAFMDKIKALTLQRAEVFQLRFRLADNVRNLTEIRTREIGELGKLIRFEQGVDEDTKTIRARLSEIDAELNLIEQTEISHLLLEANHETVKNTEELRKINQELVKTVDRTAKHAEELTNLNHQMLKLQEDLNKTAKNTDGLTEDVKKLTVWVGRFSFIAIVLAIASIAVSYHIHFMELHESTNSTVSAPRLHAVSTPQY